MKYAQPDEPLRHHFSVANYMRPKHLKGLVVHRCDCGSHVWSMPWQDDMADWIGHLGSPLRDLTEEKGFAPSEPTPSHHVVLASLEDAHFLKERRWRVFPTKKGHRAKWHLKSGRRGLPLQRMIYPTAEAIAFRNDNGCDVRRENLRRPTLRKLLGERNWRRGWKSKKAA